mmetsp:Transcript_24043/g.75391  ORF Transcript_24043/g.75391 Transcript_24043/m.75391 type:complete len:162 (-) Transcript_24043:85-570(-)
MSSTPRASARPVLQLLFISEVLHVAPAHRTVEVGLTSSALVADGPDQPAAEQRAAPGRANATLGFLELTASADHTVNDKVVAQQGNRSKLEESTADVDVYAAVFTSEGFQQACRAAGSWECVFQGKLWEQSSFCHRAYPLFDVLAFATLVGAICCVCTGRK